MGPDRYARRFQPQIGHWDREIGINQDGSVFAVRHLTGHDADLAGVRATVGLHLSANALARGLSDPRVEIWDHLIRQDGQSMSPLPPVDNWFASRFDEAYRATQGDGTLYRNDLFVTALMHPRDGLRSGMRALLGGGLAEHPQADAELLDDFAALLQTLDAGLARYGARPLGLREQGGVVFSELAEALHLIANGHFRPIGLTAGRMGRLAMPERVVFGLRDFEIVKEGEPRFGAMLSIKDYPPRTAPTMFDPLRRLPFGLVLTNAIRFQQKADALGRIGMRVKQMQSGNDAAKSQVAELAQDEDDVMSGRSVYVRHHFGLAIYAPSIETLDRRVAQTQSALSDVGLTSVRETDALAAAVAGQLPGNSRWWPRPAMTKSINAVGMAAKHDVPRGQYRGRWGAPVLMLPTTADTEYAFHFQVDDGEGDSADVGNCLLFGPTKAGKTSLLGSLCLLSLRNPATRVVVVDKDFGLSIMIRAAGGSYLVLPSGSPSGLAPLLGLTNSADDIAYLERFVRGLILSDGQGELSGDEDQRLQRAIARQMEMPPEMRGLAGVAVMLGQRAKDGAAARLRKWCRGERLGWAFDNEADLLRMDARIVGFDTTALLRDEQVCSPTLSYLFYRTRKLIDGRPIVLAVDEFWQTDRVPAFREENNDQLKTIRKNEGAVILATQSVADALRSEYAHTFKQQIPTKILFADTSASRADLVGNPERPEVPNLGLTEAEFVAVTQTLPNMRRTFLIHRPNGSVLCRFDLSGARDKLAVISGRRSTYDLMNRLIARYGAEPQAWVPHFERMAPNVADEPVMAEAAE